MPVPTAAEWADSARKGAKKGRISRAGAALARVAGRGGDWHMSCSLRRRGSADRAAFARTTRHSRVARELDAYRPTDRDTMTKCVEAWKCVEPAS